MCPLPPGLSRERACRLRLDTCEIECGDGGQGTVGGASPLNGGFIRVEFGFPVELLDATLDSNARAVGWRPARFPPDDRQPVVAALQDQCGLGQGLSLGEMKTCRLLIVPALSRVWPSVNCIAVEYHYFGLNCLI